MRNISSKTDNVGDTLPASDFNINLRLELQGIVTRSGQSLDPEGGPDTDTEMLGKAIALYSNATQYYSDTGAANAYVLSRVGTFDDLIAYVDGVIVTFKAANANTGASTINVSGLGVVDLVDDSGSALVNGDIKAGSYVTARYNDSTGDFEVLTKQSSLLFSWENLGNDFVPVSSGVGSLGSDAWGRYIENIYITTGGNIYFGDDLWMFINHDGANGLFENSYGTLTFNTSTASNIIFKTNDTSRWSFLSTGHFVPSSANAYDIGSSTLEARHIYQGDNGHHYLGSDQDLDIFHSGTFGFIDNSNGALYVGTTVATNLIFKTSDTERWYIPSTGHLLPFAANTYDIGSAALEIKNIYQADNAYHYFGSDQDAWLRYETTGNNFRLETAGTTGFVIDSADTIYLISGGIDHWLINTAGDIIPIQTTQDIGSATNPVDVIYYNTLTLVSDARLKSDKKDSLGLDFIRDLKPSSFIQDTIESNTRRYGLMAQDVEQTLKKHGLSRSDFAGIIYDDEKDIYGLDYTQFIGPMIRAIQELYDKIN